jgi:CBS domain-containing protein
METTTNPSNLRQRMQQQFQTLRDSARVQAHLIGMEARESWSDLERRLEAMQKRLATEPEHLSESVAHAVNELSEQAKNYFRSQSLTRLELRKPVSSTMSSEPITCARHARLSDVAQLMWDHGLGWLPVVEDSGALAGVITDRDLAMAAYTRGCRLAEASAESAMASPVHSCGPDDTLADALSRMVDHGVRRLPVVGDAGKVVGTLCVSDIASYVRSLTGGLYLGSPELGAILCRDRDRRRR